MASVLLLMIVTVMTRTATTADDSRTLEARGNKPYLRHLVKHTNTHNVHSRSSRQSLMPPRSLPRQSCWAVRTYVCLRWSHIIKAVSFVRGAVEAPSTTLVCTARQYTHASVTTTHLPRVPVRVRHVAPVCRATTGTKAITPEQQERHFSVRRSPRLLLPLRSIHAPKETA